MAVLMVEYFCTMLRIWIPLTQSYLLEAGRGAVEMSLITGFKMLKTIIEFLD